MGTSNHSIALARYSAAYAALEDELRALLSGEALRQRIEYSREDIYTDPDYPVPLTPFELTQGVVGKFNPNDLVHQEVYQSFESNTPIGLTWDEAIELYVKVRNRKNARPLSRGTLNNVRISIDKVRDIARPNQWTEEMVEDWIEQMLSVIKPQSLHTYISYVRAVITVAVKQRKIDKNVFTNVEFSAQANRSEKKRGLTDTELILIKQKLPVIYHLCLTGMRPGELASRSPDDRSDDCVVIDEKTVELFGKPTLWRPKTLSSYRRVPLPKDLELSFDMNDMWKWNKSLRKLIPDPLVTAHSGRHTFMTLARRAQADGRITEAISGHAKKEGSPVAGCYGEFPDEVLQREIQKVWDFAETIS